MKTRKKYKSLILCFVLMLSLLISPFANTQTTLAEENDFKINILRYIMSCTFLFYDL